MHNVETLGQVFTPPEIVRQMLLLRRNSGRVLEPSCGDGTFFYSIRKADAADTCVGIEIDEKHCPKEALNIDFFDYPPEEKFDTIIGNPPYVRFQDISQPTKDKLHSQLLDFRSNLYLFFIEKCIKHLNEKGELIFITPRDFLKATSSIRLNQFIWESGTITDIIDLGDRQIFDGFTPNCIIFRFEKGNLSHRTNDGKNFSCRMGQLFFTDEVYDIPFSEIFFVKVGAVSGLDRIFANEEFGDTDFVCSSTCKTGLTRRMIYQTPNAFLLAHKTELLARKIRNFNESNWFEWGRRHYVSSESRIYVNTKTRRTQPFFLHPCKNYDGSVLAVFPRRQDGDLRTLCTLLNEVKWADLGFVCDGRFLFSQRSLETSLLPPSFSEYIKKRRN